MADHPDGGTLPSPRTNRFDGISRSLLETTILELESRLASAEELRDDYLRNLTATQERCTKLLNEARDLRVLVNVSPGQAKVLSEIANERRNQDEKWGNLTVRKDVPDGEPGGLKYRTEMLAHVREQVTSHVGATGRETCCWSHVLEEEAAEALAALDVENLREELVQVGAVTVCWLEAIDQRGGGR